jgi:hypothetical protein
LKPRDGRRKSRENKMTKRKTINGRKKPRDKRMTEIKELTLSHIENDRDKGGRTERFYSIRPSSEFLFATEIHALYIFIALFT